MKNATYQGGYTEIVQKARVANHNDELIKQDEKAQSTISLNTV